jgi:hypothetical protein
MCSRSATTRAAPTPDNGLVAVGPPLSPSYLIFPVTAHQWVVGVGAPPPARCSLLAPLHPACITCIALPPPNQPCRSTSLASFFLNPCWRSEV